MLIQRFNLKQWRHIVADISHGPPHCYFNTAAAGECTCRPGAAAPFPRAGHATCLPPAPRHATPRHATPRRCAMNAVKGPAWANNPPHPITATIFSLSPKSPCHISSPLCKHFSRRASFISFHMPEMLSHTTPHSRSNCRRQERQDTSDSFFSERLSRMGRRADL